MWRWCRVHVLGTDFRQSRLIVGHKPKDIISLERGMTARCWDGVARASPARQNRVLASFADGVKSNVRRLRRPPIHGRVPLEQSRLGTVRERELLSLWYWFIMASASSEIDEQIERLRKGDTLAENEVKALCEKVSLHGRAMFPLHVVTESKSKIFPLSSLVCNLGWSRVYGRYRWWKAQSTSLSSRRICVVITPSDRQSPSKQR